MTSNGPLFNFVHATDLHYESGPTPAVPNANARIGCLIDDINSLHEECGLAFALISGDLSNRGSALEEDLVAARGLCEQLEIPCHVIAGNHDLAPHRAIAGRYPGKEDYHEGPIETSPFVRVFGPAGHHFSVARQGYRFLGFSLRDGDPDASLDWLENEMASAEGHLFVIGHYGLHPPRDAGPLHTWGFARIAACLPRLRSIMGGAGNRPIAYLYGHNHINSVVDQSGTVHISGGGIQKGCTGYRLFRCFTDRVETSYRYLSDRGLWDFDYWSGDDPAACADASHPTAEQYHRGTESEQFGTIYLTGSP